MDNNRNDYRGYLITTLLGAAAGGLIVAWITHAVPKMMKRMMANMMENMRTQMSTGGCKPEEI
jgi:hypothetical protein